MAKILEGSGFVGEVRENERLSPYVAFKIGGPADYLLFPGEAEDIRRCYSIASREKLPVTILGSGSNVLVRDGGIRGMVLYLGNSLPGDVEVLEENESSVLWSVPSHWIKARLLDRSLEYSLSGLEFSAGIPGTLGGAVYMNAGTKWGNYSEIIESVEFFSPAQGFYVKNREALAFAYRSHGDGDLKDGALVVRVNLRLKKGKSLSEIRSKVDEILTYRGLKQPLELPNCGSVFKNPPDSEKGAGRLIEACGLKGVRVGGASFSMKHANFILNEFHAKSDDVESLIQLAQKKVKRKFKIDLEPEVIVLGERACV